MATPLCFGTATPGDVPELEALVQTAYRGPGGWTNEIGLVEGRRIDAAELRGVVEEEDSVVVVATERAGGAIIGCCRVSDAGGGVAMLGLLAVRPARQGAGVGRGLVDCARRLAVERFAADALEISVVSGQPALLAWYGRLGFRATGRTRPFADDDPNDRPLVPGLHFVVMRSVVGAVPDAFDAGRGPHDGGEARRDR